MSRAHSFVGFLAVCIILIAGCDSPPDEQADEPPGTEATEAEEQLEAEQLEELDEETRQAALLDPELVTDQAPDDFQVAFETTRGEFVVDVDRQWAPHGADRLFNLVRIGYYDDVAFFRVIDNFMAQFGIHDDPEVNDTWRRAEIPDDEVARSNERGTLTFATRGPDTRTTQLFVNLNDNPDLDDQGFSPVGEVAEGMDVVDSLYSGYGEGAPQGDGPSQQRIQQEGNDYLRDEFEDLDWVESASIVTGD